MPGMSVKQEKEYAEWIKDISTIKECKDNLNILRKNNEILRKQVEDLKIMLIPGDNLMGMKRRKKIKTKKKKKKKNKKKKKSKKNKY